MTGVVTLVTVLPLALMSFDGPERVLVSVALWSLSWVVLYYGMK